MEGNRRWLLSGVPSKEICEVQWVRPLQRESLEELVEVGIVRCLRREVVTRNLARLLMLRR